MHKTDSRVPLFASDAAAEEYLVALRWPNGVLCPKCQASDPSIKRAELPTIWRCHSCRKDFTTTTGTALHRSKVGIAKWLAAAWMADIRPATLGRALKISGPAARRMSLLLEHAESLPGEQRLRKLLFMPPSPEEVIGVRLPHGYKIEDNPLKRLSRGQRMVMGLLRKRGKGTTAESLADDANLSLQHTQRCLDALSKKGYASASNERVPWGYGSITMKLWHLSFSRDCIRALAYLPKQIEKPDFSCPERLPPELWGMFWSGTSGKDLRLPEDAPFVASTLLLSSNDAAVTWALTHLPIEAIQECRQMRGCDIEPLASAIDSAVKERVNA